MNEFDYIVVGAGSAGNVLAARLSEDPDITVLLLEAGGPDYRTDFRTQMPAALAYPLQGGRYNWRFLTDPEPNLNGRRLDCSRGKGLGGSSLINGMCYIRGNALDLENWASMPGLSDWSYGDCLPYYRKAETRDAGADAYHGASGPVHVTRTRTAGNELFTAIIEAASEAGYPKTDDLNGFQQEGFGPMDRTVTPRGRRSSTARGYLDMARGRSNLKIITYATTERVTFKGLRATGVHYLVGSSRAPVLARARREVIVSSGAIASPQLLQRSGVGPADLLRRVGADVVLDLPGVGQNLQDHLEAYIQFECLKPVSLAPALEWHRKLPIGAEWLFAGTGLGASNQFEAGGFVRSNDEVVWPNIQYHFVPLAISTTGKRASEGHNFQAHVGSMRSPSRGRIELKSVNPYEHPSILFNYMSDPQDWKEFREGIRIAREIFDQPALRPYKGSEIGASAGCETDDEIHAFIQSHAETAYHPSCSCRMGTDDQAVVDSEGRVHGIKNLRIVDASIMPQIITGNLNATTIMMAEKIADRVRGKDAIPRSDEPFFIADPAHPALPFRRN